MKKFTPFFASMFLLFFALFSVVPSYGAESRIKMTDSVLTNEQQISINAVSIKAPGGVPVGTVIIWPVASNPEDPDKWLECDGRSIDSADYPELRVKVGPNIPNYQGLFLRGVGGNSAAIGILQNDMVGPHDHILQIQTYINSGPRGYIQDENGSYSIDFRTLPGNNMGPETRPANKAVRYLIRALP